MYIYKKPIFFLTWLKKQIFQIKNIEILDQEALNIFQIQEFLAII